MIACAPPSLCPFTYRRPLRTTHWVCRRSVLRRTSLSSIHPRYTVTCRACTSPSVWWWLASVWSTLIWWTCAADSSWRKRKRSGMTGPSWLAAPLSSLLTGHCLSTPAASSRSVSAFPPLRTPAGVCLSHGVDV